MIDLSTIGTQTGIPGVLSLDSFDKDLADAGGYCVTLGVKTSVGRGTLVKPIKSVGASKRAPGRFYFAIDERFRNWPGFGLVWPSPPGVTGVKSVPIEIIDEPVRLSPQEVSGIDDAFRMLEQVAEENGLRPETEAP